MTPYEYQLARTCAEASRLMHAPEPQTRAEEAELWLKQRNVSYWLAHLLSQRPAVTLDPKFYRRAQREDGR